MKTVFTWLGLIVLGLALGIGLAVWQIRSSGLGNDVRVGPWSTGRDVGTANADIKTRAIVALRGLLALPAREARYFTAATDSAGAPLSGKCRYALSGGAIEARWWSVTLYDRGGWLIANRWNRHSVGSARIPAGETDKWTVLIGPDEQPGLWIPTGGDGPFELTLRAYRPQGLMARDPARISLPTITRRECRP
ncbi:DUF1214 domain-containing protein [Novosphingobium sp.]|uniref:DUF1214 domain-containing protein n=1 Tax=Novosphingobium sp. TaxID=1874826 RepID=UPI001DCD1D92|nr:DUF1214 domain-containing protein [Novosphingobium sp.]MBX9662427.1 DUF1214 domain-containing protein [Novosphingobium sp.]